MDSKKRITQEDVAKSCKIDQGSVSRILNEDTRDSFAEDTVRKVFRAARELGYLHPSLVSTDRRASARKKAGIPARMAIIIGTSTIYDDGQVDVDEVSMSGMLLRNFRTRKRTLPMDRFRFDVEVQEGKLKSAKLRCRMVRFSEREDEFAVAVRFEHLDEDAKEKLRSFCK